MYIEVVNDGLKFDIFAHKLGKVFPLFLPWFAPKH